MFGFKYMIMTILYNIYTHTRSKSTTLTTKTATNAVCIE